MFIDQLISFIISANRDWPTNIRWIADSTFKCYVRRANRLIEGERRTMLDLANMEATTPGQKTFTKLLQAIEELKPYEGIFIENVLSQRFAKFFVRMGYTQDSRYSSDLPCFYKLFNQ